MPERVEQGTFDEGNSSCGQPGFGRTGCRRKGRQIAGDTNEEQNVEQNIRMRAYLLWELEGRQEGGAGRYWHRARELIDDESRSASPRRSGSNQTAL